MVDLLLWRGDEAVLADRRRRVGSIAWLAPVGTQWGWRVPGTRGLAPTREDAQAAAEATLRAVLTPEALDRSSLSCVHAGRQTWAHIRALLAVEPLTAAELAERSGSSRTSVTEWIRRQKESLRPVGTRGRCAVVWALR